MTFEMIAPILLLLALTGLAVASTLWGEDSALRSSTRIDGRAIRTALKPE